MSYVYIYIDICTHTFLINRAFVSCSFLIRTSVSLVFQAIAVGIFATGPPRDAQAFSLFRIRTLILYVLRTPLPKNIALNTNTLH